MQPWNDGMAIFVHGAIDMKHVHASVSTFVSKERSHVFLIEVAHVQCQVLEFELEIALSFPMLVAVSVSRDQCAMAHAWIGRVKMLKEVVDLLIVGVAKLHINFVYNLERFFLCSRSKEPWTMCHDAHVEPADESVWR